MNISEYLVNSLSPGMSFRNCFLDSYCLLLDQAIRQAATNALEKASVENYVFTLTNFWGILSNFFF